MFQKMINTLNFKLFCVLLLAQVLYACQSELKFSGEDSKPKLVISSFVSPNDTIKVHVSLSKFFLSNSSYSNVEDAKVDLFLNGKYAATLIHKAAGEYYAAIKPNSGDVVRLEIESPKYGTAAVESYVPTPQDKMSVQPQIDMYNQMYLSINDNSSTEDYYRIVGIQQIEYYSNTDKKQVVSKIGFKLFNNLEGDQLPKYESTDGYPLYFSDKLFNGKTITLELEPTMYDSVYNVKSLVSSQDTINYPILDSIRYDFEIQSITEDYYLFLKTSKLSETKSFLQEPVQVKSNVIGGIGILGAFSSLRVSKTWIPIEK